jgi:hypothetical protein
MTPFEMELIFGGLRARGLDGGRYAGCYASKKLRSDLGRQASAESQENQSYSYRFRKHCMSLLYFIQVHCSTLSAITEATITKADSRKFAEFFPESSHSFAA